jgi:hypothetical protein
MLPSTRRGSAAQRGAWHAHVVQRRVEAVGWSPPPDLLRRRASATAAPGHTPDRPQSATGPALPAARNSASARHRLVRAAGTHGNRASSDPFLLPAPIQNQASAAGRPRGRRTYAIAQEEASRSRPATALRWPTTITSPGQMQTAAPTNRRPRQRQAGALVDCCSEAVAHLSGSSGPRGRVGDEAGVWPGRGRLLVIDQGDRVSP